MTCCACGSSTRSFSLAGAIVLAAGAMYLMQPNRDGKAPDAGKADEWRSLSREERTEKLLSEYDTSNPKIERSQFLAPGPKRDGIPSLTAPKRVAVTGVEFPAPGDRVIEVTIGDQAVAYPLNILNWHEIINDEVGGVPIAATYCPLCDSVAVVDRRLERADGSKRTVELGVSGLLCNSNVVMYDKQTMSLWSQVMMEAVTGPDSGRGLNHLPFEVVRFDEFQKRHPTGQTLTENTGHERDYRSNPYRDYMGSNRVFHGFNFRKDLPPHTLGLGVRAGNKEWFVVATDAMEKPITLHTDAGDITVSATADGVGVASLPKGVSALQTFYHSWSAFHPNTLIVPESAVQREQEAASKKVEQESTPKE